jgi:hypothetical protein
VLRSRISVNTTDAAVDAAIAGHGVGTRQLLSDRRSCTAGSAGAHSRSI